MIEFRSLAHLDPRIGPIEERRDTLYRLKLDALMKPASLHATLAYTYNASVIRLNAEIAKIASAELTKREEAALHRAFPDDHKG